MTPFEKSKKEAYERLMRQDLEMARYVRDVISKSDDTKKVYEVIKSLLQAAESRVLMDMGEGKSPNGERYSESDFRERVGEVAGLRWLPSRVASLVQKADAADEAERSKSP